MKEASLLSPIVRDSFGAPEPGASMNTVSTTQVTIAPPKPGRDLSAQCLTYDTSSNEPVVRLGRDLRYRATAPLWRVSFGNVARSMVD